MKTHILGAGLFIELMFICDSDDHPWQLWWSHLHFICIPAVQNHFHSMFHSCGLNCNYNCDDHIFISSKFFVSRSLVYVLVWEVTSSKTIQNGPRLLCRFRKGSTCKVKKFKHPTCPFLILNLNKQGQVVQSWIKLTQGYREFWLQFCNFLVRCSV